MVQVVADEAKASRTHLKNIHFVANMKSFGYTRKNGFLLWTSKAIFPIEFAIMRSTAHRVKDREAISNALKT